MKKNYKNKYPCNFDHNGECLICDCWSEHCAWYRLLNKDYTYENKEELIKMFEDEGIKVPGNVRKDT